MQQLAEEREHTATQLVLAALPQPAREGQMPGPAAPHRALAFAVTPFWMAVIHCLNSACAAQVRWFSFQFVMQQLAEELEDMHTAMQLVLTALPKPPKRGRARDLLGPIEPLLPR